MKISMNIPFYDGIHFSKKYELSMKKELNLRVFGLV